MQKETTKELTRRAIDQLIEALESGQSATLTAYLSAMSNFHNYSLNNCMLIGMQCPEAKQVAGFVSWKKLNRFVKKGEKGIKILAPMIGKDDDGERVVYGFRVANVFDISQTDGDELPNLDRVQGDPVEFSDRLNQMITNEGIELSYAHDLGGPDGLSSGGMITIKNGLAAAEDFGVRVHELAHEMLHQGEKNKDTRPKSKTVRETEAEAVTFVVSHAVGLEVGTACTDYIQLYDGDRETLESSLQRIQATSTDIIQGITN